MANNNKSYGSVMLLSFLECEMVYVRHSLCKHLAIKIQGLTLYRLEVTTHTYLIIVLKYSDNIQITDCSKFETLFHTFSRRLLSTSFTHSVTMKPVVVDCLTSPLYYKSVTSPS